MNTTTTGPVTFLAQGALADFSDQEIADLANRYTARRRSTGASRRCAAVYMAEAQRRGLR